MRVVHVTDCYLPRVGGIELHVRDLADQQRAAGHDVLVVTTTPGESLPGLMRVRDRRTDWLTGLSAEVVQAHVSVVSPFAMAAARRTSYAGVPTVVTVHSLWTHLGPLPELTRELWGMGRWPVMWSAVSEPAAEPVRHLLGVPVHVLPNAVDLSAWLPLPLGPVDGRPRVLSVMRLTAVKRALPLLDVLRSAAGQVDLRATVIGDGPKRAAMERYVDRHGLADVVELAGTQQRDVIRQRLAGAVVFLAPAHRESFGIAALEARASGVPVLASARSGVASFVTHGQDGLLARDDREMADELVRLLADERLRTRIAEHNRLVAPRFGWAEALSDHARVYALAGAVDRQGARAVVAR